MKEPIKLFDKEKQENIRRQGEDHQARDVGLKFLSDTAQYKYSYNFTWMGRPIIAFPQDMIAMQEIIWTVKPDLIIEAGIAHGGSIIYYASLLELIGKEGMVLGIDIDIRQHNRDLIEGHPMFKRIQMIESSSVSQEVADQVYKIAKDKKRIMVCLDSNHTHEHVLKELELYAHLTSVGSYCVVFDTVVDDMPVDFFPNRPWGPENNPKTAVNEFLGKHSEFVADQEMDNKLLISVAPGGYLKRVK